MILLTICGRWMTRFIAGTDRGQSTLLPEYLEDWIDESNSVRVIDAFVDALDLGTLGFDGMSPAATGRSAYHPSSRSLSTGRMWRTISRRAGCR